MEENPAIVAGNGRTLGAQALMQVNFDSTNSQIEKEISAFGAGHHLASIHHSWGCNWPLHLHEEAFRNDP